MNFQLKIATINDVDAIWFLLKQGIEKRKNDGSNQWQDGYPNRDVVLNDVKHNYGVVVLNEQNTIVGYIAMIDEIEPAYEEIIGNWLSAKDEKYMVFHRLIVDHINPTKGLATWILNEVEQLVIKKGVKSIKVDTNYDNVGMLRVFEKLGYTFCGKVYFRGSERLAFEKIVIKN